MYWYKNCITFFPHFRTSHFLNLLLCFWSSDLFGSDNRAPRNKPLISLPSEIIHFFNSRKQILQQFHVHSSCQEFQNVWIFFPRTDCYGMNAVAVVPVAVLLMISAGRQCRVSWFHAELAFQAGRSLCRREALLQALCLLIWPQGLKLALQRCLSYRRDDQLLLLWYSLISAQ